MEEQLDALKHRSRLAEKPKVEFEELETVLLAYRRNTELYKDARKEKDSITFSNAQRAQIRDTLEKFPQFAQLLIEKNQGKDLENLRVFDKSTREKREKVDLSKELDDLTARFVKWALRAGAGHHERGNDIEVFIKMPLHARDLAKINIDKRIGSISQGRGLEIRKDQHGFEVLCIKIDGTFHNIMRGHEQDRVLLRNQINPKARPVEVTIDEIWKGFKSKTYGYGEFDWFHETGVTLWNAIELGSWNPDKNDGAGGYDQIDPNDPLCLESMPVTQVIDRAEFERIYPGQTLPQGTEWGLAMRATRSTGLNIDSTHGFCSLYQPLGDGTYRAYPLGFQADSFPNQFKEKLIMLAATCDAGMHYPDESGVLSQREHMGKLYCISKKEADSFLIPRFQKLIRRAQAGTLYFQPQGKNCGYIAQGLFNEVIGSELYGKLKGLIKSTLPHTETELKEIFTKAFKSFDDETLEKVTEKLLSELSEKGDLKALASLFNASVEILSRTLFKDNPEPIEALDQIRANFDTTLASAPANKGRACLCNEKTHY